MTVQSFPVGSEPSLDVRIVGGTVRIVSGEPGSIDVTVTGRAAVDVNQLGDAVIVHQPKRRFGTLEVTAVVPPGVFVHAELASADLVADVELGSVAVEVATGDVRLKAVVGEAAIATASGDVRIGRVGGRAVIETASGDVTIAAAAGDTECHTFSGDVAIGAATSRVAVNTASGALRVDSFAGTALLFNSMSGDARIGLPSGRLIDVDIETLSGDVRNEFEVAEGAPNSGGRARMTINTLSGDVTVLSA